MMLLWYERFSNLWPLCKRSLGSVLDRVSQREPFVVQKVKLRNPLLCKGRKWNKPGMIFASLAISLYFYVTWLLTFSWYYTDVSISCLPSPVWFLSESLFYAACVHSSAGMFRHLESWGSTYTRVHKLVQTYSLVSVSPHSADVVRISCSSSKIQHWLRFYFQRRKFWIRNFDNKINIEKILTIKMFQLLKCQNQDSDLCITAFDLT